MGRVVLKRDGCFYRVSVDPVEALPLSFARPSTYTNHAIASDVAHLLAEATGFPLVDETRPKGGGHGQA